MRKLKHKLVVYYKAYTKFLWADIQIGWFNFRIARAKTKRDYIRPCMQVIDKCR